jgi:hypothetical protein
MEPRLTKSFRGLMMEFFEENFGTISFEKFYNILISAKTFQKEFTEKV